MATGKFLGPLPGAELGSRMKEIASGMQSCMQCSSSGHISRSPRRVSARLGKKCILSHPTVMLGWHNLRLVHPLSRMEHDCPSGIFRPQIFSESSGKRVASKACAPTTWDGGLEGVPPTDDKQSSSSERAAPGSSAALN